MARNGNSSRFPGYVLNVNIEFRGCKKVLHENRVVLGADRWRGKSKSSRFVFLFVNQLYRRSEGHVLRLFMTYSIALIAIKVILEGFSDCTGK
jgi:hypothetical protein